MSEATHDQPAHSPPPDLHPSPRSSLEGDDSSPRSPLIDPADALFQTDDIQSQLESISELFRKQAILQLQIRRTQADLHGRDTEAAARETELVRLKDDTTARATELAEASAALDASRAEHQRSQAALEDALNQLEERERTLIARATQLSEQQHAHASLVERFSRDHEASSHALAETKSQLADQHAQLVEAQISLTADLELLARDQQTLALDRQKLAAECLALEENRTLLDQATSDLHIQLIAAQALHDQAESRLLDIAERETQLKTQTADLEAERKSLSKTIEELTQARAQLALEESCTAAQAEHNSEQARLLAAQAQEVANQTKQLTEQEQQLIRMGEGLEAKARAAEELTTQAKNQPNTQLEAELNTQLAAKRAAELETQLAQERATREQLQSQLVILQSAISQATLPPEAPALRENESAVELAHEYQSLWLLELDRAWQLEAAGRVSTADIEELEGLVEALKERLRAAHDRLRSLENTAASVTAAPAGPAAASLEHRRRRLQQYKSILRTQSLKIRRASEALQKRFEQVEQVLAQRADLAAARIRIINAEKRSKNHSAARSAAACILCAAAVTVLLGAVGWAVAREVAPARFAATTIIKASSPERNLTDGERAEWQNLHESLLADPRFHEALAERFRRQSMPALSTPGDVAELAKTNLSHETPGDGELKIRLEGIGDANTARTLEIFTNGLLNYVNSGNVRRVDGAVTILAQPSAVGTGPIDSIRTKYAMAIGGVGTIISLALGFFIWGRLSRAKSTFEQDADLDRLLSQQ